MSAKERIWDTRRKGSPEQSEDRATKKVGEPVKKQNKEMNAGLNIFLDLSISSCDLWGGL